MIESPNQYPFNIAEWIFFRPHDDAYVGLKSRKNVSLVLSSSFTGGVKSPRDFRFLRCIGFASEGIYNRRVASI